ncbi:MAG: ImmA/IrrE family metallo-endopeptidase [Solirubrobacteraceae bacterium]
MTVRVPVHGALIAWAQKRSRVPRDTLLARFPALEAWETGERLPTLKQLEKFAQATHTPVGYLLMAEPPEDTLPVPDFRTLGEAEVGHASPDLLDTVYECQQRQDWYRDYARATREPPVAFIGSLTLDDDVVEAAQHMRTTLSFEPSNRGATWSEAARRLRDQADQQGVLVMINGVVGSNTHRKLDPGEFRGFALVDPLAPLVFVNGADTKAAQIFTLAHELAHLWLGESGVSDIDLAETSTNQVERWCNRIAAELLLPLADLGRVNVDDTRITHELERLAHEFKVSTLVALRRVFDDGQISEERYWRAYASERDRVLTLMNEREAAGGGNFYNTQPIRVSSRFARALIQSTLEGQTLHRDAFRMLGFKKHSTFEELAHRLEVA